MNSGARTFIISLGGSIIIPKEGIATTYLLGFRDLIQKRVNLGDRFIIICGGGTTARQYQAAARKMVNPEVIKLDWIGIHCTRLNAQLVWTLFGDLASPEIVLDPHKLPSADAKVVIGAGWEPGCSTDLDAVMMAKTCSASTVINLSNIRYVYDKDPNQFPDAKPMHSLTWPEFRNQFAAKEWTPGLNSPFDPIASKEAEQLGLRVVIADGNDLPNVEKILSSQPFEGTEIK